MTTATTTGEGKITVGLRIGVRMTIKVTPPPTEPTDSQADEPPAETDRPAAPAS